VVDPTGAMFSVISGGIDPGPAPYLRSDPGAVCWVDLLTRDTETAAEFYREVFEWTTLTDPSGRDYAQFSLGEESFGGIMDMPENVPADAPAHWSVYFTVEDCAATETMAKELGGEVLVPTTTADGMRFAVLADPSGAKFHVLEML